MSTAVQDSPVAVPDAPPPPVATQKKAELKGEKEADLKADLKQELVDQAKEKLQEKLQEEIDDQMADYVEGAKDELKGHAEDLVADALNNGELPQAPGWFSSMFSCSCTPPEMPNLEIPNMDTLATMELPAIPDMEELKKKAVAAAAEAAGFDPEFAVKCYEVSQDPIGLGPEFVMEFGAEKVQEVLSNVIGEDAAQQLMDKIQSYAEEKVEQFLEKENEGSEGEADKPEKKKADAKKSDKKDAAKDADKADDKEKDQKDAEGEPEKATE